ncbi:hypothetical protein FSP39_024019 [Pinctada imbricata]|uniref:Exonuclease domain-containing protein n=1 Tax=Pinctada imbricata TaxID=66713 RepID=A0AA89BRU8_PINIB|nr:hypothetical protein FSP39_024019 [Pinctada imbricata]
MSETAGNTKTGIGVGFGLPFWSYLLEGVDREEGAGGRGGKRERGRGREEEEKGKKGREGRKGAGRGEGRVKRRGRDGRREDQTYTRRHSEMAIPREKVASFVFLDFEATGLLGPGERPKITEMSMVACQREEMLDINRRACPPRVQNKLTLCFNPNKMIHPHASHVTGLYNDMLESQSAFDSDSVTMMSIFLSRLPQPVCFIAHNGNGYDFQLLNAELKKVKCSLPESLLCADSLEAFRESNFEAASPLTVQIPTAQTDKTPVGQPIPAVPEQALDIKGRVRQVKRKCDPDFDNVPIEAKSVRKRLFDSAGKSSDEAKIENGGSISLVGHKPVGSSMKMQSDVVSKRTTCDVESVKKKLSFASDCDSDSDDDTLNNSSMSTRSIDIEMSDDKSFETNCNDCETGESNVEEDQQSSNDTKKEVPYFSDQREELQSQRSLFDSQGSISHEDFFSAVEKFNDSLGESYNAGCHVNLNCTKESSSSICNDIFSSPKSAPRPTECHTPQSAGASNTSTKISTPESVVTNGHANVKENCLTPMSGLALSTSMCQLGTPVGVMKKKPELEISSNACRALRFKEGESMNGNIHSSNNSTISSVSQPNFNTFPGLKSSLLTKANFSKFSKNIFGSSSETQVTTKSAQVPTGKLNGSLATTPTGRPKLSNKLEEIYRRTFKKSPQNSHSSESDCITLMELVKYYSPQFIQWIDEHAVPLVSIAPGY